MQAISGSLGGGAVLVTGAGAGMPTFDHCTFTQNVGDSGGALNVQTSGIAITNCFFDGNQAVQSAGGRGGAVMSESRKCQGTIEILRRFKERRPHSCDSIKK